MQREKNTARRPRGTGSLYTRRNRAGRENWYCRFYAGGRQLKRAIGLRRLPGTRIGLTKPQAEAELRRLIDEAGAASQHELFSFADATAAYLHSLEGRGRKSTTIGDYDSAIRIHLSPFFGDLNLSSVTPKNIEAFMSLKAREGKSPKSVRNWLSLLHAIFAFGERRGWCTANPVKRVEKPRVPEALEIRFLDHCELEALLRAVPDDELGSVERVLYLAAACSGLRQGELLGLRWRDVDWGARRIRVRRSRSRDGGWTTPKSRRGSRSVPLADRLGGDLDHLSRETSFSGDDDLVFAHPQLGRPLDHSKVRKRFKRALARAGVRQVRFHDLRHTFGTRMAAAGAPIRTIQEWMGHRDHSTTLIYADYQPGDDEAEFIDRAFRAGGASGATEDPDSHLNRHSPVRRPLATRSRRGRG